MIKRVRITTIILVGLMLITLQCFAKNAEEGYQSFSVTFEQNGKRIKPNGHIINLEKKEFVINVDFLGYQGEQAAIRLNTSINDNYYKVASNGMQVTDLLADGIGMAEPVDVQKNLILTDMKAVQYLVINANRSRFQEVKVSDKAISGKRYVTELNFRGGKNFPISNLPVNELYMVFIKRSSTGIQQEYYLIQFPKPEFPKQALTPEQWMQQGLNFEQLKDYGLAIEAYSKAIATDSQYNYLAYQRRGMACAALGRFNQALTDSNAALTITPDNIEAYFFRAYVLTAIGSKSQAIDDYSKIIALNPNLSRAYWNRAMLNYNEKNRFSLKREELLAALADFSKVIDLEPDNASAFNNRAGIYHVLKEYDKALVDYDRAISLAPNNVRYYEARNLTYTAITLTTGRETSEEAWENVNKIVELDPRSASAYSLRATIGRRLSKDFASIKADLDMAIKLYSEKGGASYNIANLLFEKGDLLRANRCYDEALATYRAIYNYAPQNKMVFHKTGVTYFEKGDYDKAIADCSAGIAQMNYSWTYLIRGRAFKAKGMIEEAKSDFTKALSLQPNLVEAKAELDSL